METNRNRINQHNSSHELIFHHFLYRFLSFSQEGVVELFLGKIKVVCESIRREHGGGFAEGRESIQQEEKNPDCIQAVEKKFRFLQLAKPKFNASFDPQRRPKSREQLIRRRRRRQRTKTPSEEVQDLQINKLFFSCRSVKPPKNKRINK